jgi:hypothetical protein
MNQLYDSLLNLLSSNESLKENEYLLLKDCCILVNSELEPYSHDIVLKLLEKKHLFSTLEAKKLINALARKVGLFPYMNLDEASYADTIAYFFFKPDDLSDSNIVFHRPQSEVFQHLLDGENVILSAPTSFGKSLIIDALVASRRYDSIAIIVPTIALIDETRKRLSAYKDIYKIITHASQSLGGKNLFILTQERAVDFLNSKVDLFIIDEFYKIQPTPTDQDRSYVLNHAFYKLYKTGAQFYMLGPAIEGVILPADVRYIFKKLSYKTVLSEFHRVPVPGGRNLETLVKLCHELRSESTLIYCASPKSASNVAFALHKSLPDEVLNQDFASWLEDSFHPSWSLPLMISKGIGIHHGKMPRSVSQLVVKYFNEGKINILICTSTLIEGVNTKAKNVIVYDNIVAHRRLDFFTFNNICGRSGRMFQHFVGKIYLFHDRPSSNELFVDFPVLNQGNNTPSKLLVQIGAEDLNPISEGKLQFLKDQDLLSIATIKNNSNIAPESQLLLAKELLDNIGDYYYDLNWNAAPTYNQLQQICVLIWKYFNTTSRTRSVASSKHLAFRINRVVQYKSMQRIIRSRLMYTDNSEEISTKIDDELNFIRLWVMHTFPKYLRALDSIQKEVFTKLGLEAGDYSSFANQLENLFSDPTITALDEYGIPLQIAQKIQAGLRPNGNLDEVLINLKNLDLSGFELTAFEIEVINDARMHL